MSELEKDKLIEGHEYDGIRELDNPLPSWWLWLFFCSMIFAFLYFIHYSLGGGGLSSDESLALQLKEIKQKKQLEVLKKAESHESEEYVNLDTILSDKDKLAEGQKLFGQFCASCHGDHAQGVIGPNLTDKYWIHSKGEFNNIIEAIENGFPSKGMPPWEAVIAFDKRPLIAAFVKSLKDTNPSNAKPPQGEMVE
jgi:cytochrome c oxidase cbb3-type subunit III